MNERLQIVQRIYYQRGRDTFPKEEGSCSEDDSRFLLSILDVPTNEDRSTIQNAINFARSWIELGRILPQKVINKIVLYSFYTPAYIPQLALLAPLFPSRNWLFNSIDKILRTKTDLFKKSIKENNPVWGFILREFDEDFYEKSELLDKSYDERAFAFLAESVIFSWPYDQSTNVTISQLVQAFAQFCIEHQSTASNGLLSVLAPIFPNEISQVADGCLERLSSASLTALYTLGYIKKGKSNGDKFILAMKLLPRMPDVALDYIHDSYQTIEGKTVLTMKEHFDSENNCFIP